MNVNSRGLAQKARTTSGVMPAQEEICELDREIVRLLKRRLALCLNHRQRADQLLARMEAFRTPAWVESVGDDPTGMSRSDLDQIFRAIGDVFQTYTEAAGRQMSCAYVGPSADMPHQVAARCFGRRGLYAECESEEEVLDRVAEGEIQCGIVALEYSMIGPNSSAFQLIKSKGLRVWRRVGMEVHLCLMGRSDTHEVTQVLSDQVALEQCKSNLSRLGVDSCKVRGLEAIRRVRENRGYGLLASPLLAGIWGLDILVRNMEDEPAGETFFAIVRRPR
ncbi:MAG: prephenate dehydratase domain-containing protein [Verrucomicrobiota bacterium]